ncbi:MAG: DUF1284 domain-containing protein [Bacteroidales bacterium]
MIKIKPHHFFDIIKLYGKGIDIFYPDKQFNHDFYKIANTIVGNPKTEILLTIAADDICQPCNYLGKEKKCIDKINHIEGIDLKEKWNEIIDKRIIEKTGIGEGSKLSARDYCEILMRNLELVNYVWQEENVEQKKFRYNTFIIGARKYLSFKENNPGWPD